jgi:hypothetical protein
VCESNVPHPVFTSPLKNSANKEKSPHAIFYDTKKHVKITTKYSIKSLKNPLPFHG